MAAKRSKTRRKKQSPSLLDRAMTKTGVMVLTSLVVGVIGIVGLVQSYAQKPAKTGNGAPSGSHYNLNIIGVPKSKTAEITSGNRIFVPLEGNCKIDLSEGSFAVLDGNCSDGSKAAFQLPHPDADGDGITTYSVWARPLGKPGGKATATTCGIDPITLDEVCSIESTAVVRTKGKSSFTDVSKGFLTVYVDLDGDASTPPERLSIFDDKLEDYFWSYDNNGLKLLQLRFYPQESDVR